MICVDISKHWVDLLGRAPPYAGHCGKSVFFVAQVICVAEGAGQEAMEKTLGTDASGNPILADVGIFLRDKLKAAIKVRLFATASYTCLACGLQAAYHSVMGTMAGLSLQESMCIGFPDNVLGCAGRRCQVH